MTPQVVVIGSANADLILPVAHLPAPGETVTVSGPPVRSAGGKGANQAAAAARAGARTAFIAAVGDDEQAGTVRAALHAVDLSLLRTGALSTGSAVVLVAADGENSIVVTPGANAALRGLRPADRDAIAGAEVVLGQLETPVETFVEAARVARAAGTLVLLNAAPATLLAADVLRVLDMLIVNEGEAQALGGVDALTAAVPEVVVTRGADGSSRLRRGHAPQHVAAVAARRVVDTTGAGDAYCGALAAALALGHGRPDALGLAARAGARAVEYVGAVPPD